MSDQTMFSHPSNYKLIAKIGADYSHPLHGMQHLMRLGPTARVPKGYVIVNEIRGESVYDVPWRQLREKFWGLPVYYAMPDVWTAPVVGVINDSIWRNEPPTEDGDYFYAGNVPDGAKIVGIVQIFTHPVNNERMVCTLIPPGWLGNISGKQPTIHSGTLDKWNGQWAGPEGGLFSVSCGGDSDE
jgi:hypothetical protein